ncbi:cytochrome b/b6 domain-containing protein [Gloeobacter morelensis]|uniref:Cytochrome b/b6 domain-containing protein n=1 Tax=Gloeobacter morelensis MG652769 TaxID=2781736 RepID=A0ABY3PMP8_9CYAN|nr:cytochrome b/b6 domain-containing protein [Gloeobacter morelensis]UFP94966.1 cytochrome b/b6 domain-containing protein [Gloeobacter morelensis MG652769]
MKQLQPYQPLLLRILHALTGLFVAGAIITAFWTYDTYDGRWGRVPLPRFEEIEGIHGTFGLSALLIFPAFALYAFHQGQRRLVQPDTLAKLGRVGRPAWWYSLGQVLNTLALLALTLSLFSGKMMDEKWLPKGELDHAWYYVHLSGWLVLVVCVVLHVLIHAKVGGVPLLLSMVNWGYRAEDSPALWPARVRAWWSGLRLGLPGRFPASKLVALEVVVLGSIAAAWVISLLKEAGD